MSPLPSPASASADDELPPELLRLIESLARAHVEEDYAAALVQERAP